MASVAFSPVDAPALAPQRTGGAHRWLLGLIAILVAAAAFPVLRIEIGGLQVPLHVAALMLGIPSAVRRFTRIPPRVRTWLFVFGGLFAVSVLRYGEEFGDLVKMGTTLTTLVIVASLVRNRDGFRFAIVAFAIALIVINLRGMFGGITANVGYEPLRGIANKNAYSIYALPMAMMSAFALMHLPRSFLTTTVHAAAIVTTVFILFTGANRSGWIGILMIGALLTIQARQWRALAMIVALGGVSYVAFALFGTTEIFDYRLEQTRSGYQSDDIRQSLLLTAIEIGVENPLLGVGVQELGRELAKRIQDTGDAVDSHNFLGYIIGGCGLFTFLAMCMLGLSLARRPSLTMSKVQLLSHDLLRMLLVLFVFRGLFSREVFSVASFPIAMGLALGLALSDDA